MVNSCAVCGCCTRTDIVREHLEDTLRICDVSAKGLYSQKYVSEGCIKGKTPFNPETLPYRYNTRKILFSVKGRWQ